MALMLLGQSIWLGLNQCERLRAFVTLHQVEHDCLTLPELLDRRLRLSDRIAESRALSHIVI